VIYEAHPTEVSYTIEYGYLINCTGFGKYNIKYDCDLPEVLEGEIISTVVHDNNYENKILATFNTVKSWNITSESSMTYDLGITASVRSEYFLVSDLNGKDALTIQEIQNQYPDLVDQYCKPQSNGTITFIDPNNALIKATANYVLNQAETNNSFLVAKELFKWLKHQTTYGTNSGQTNVKPASETLKNKVGDCDDLSFLYISLCKSLGLPARFIRGIHVDFEKNQAIAHAWVEVFVGPNIGKEGWIPVECAGTTEKVETEIHQNFGIEGVGHLRLFKDDGSNESLNASLTDIRYLVYGSDRKINPEAYLEIASYSILKSNELVIDENGMRSYD
jgi:transglutaminase-like putative cysteine protease